MYMKNMVDRNFNFVNLNNATTFMFFFLQEIKFILNFINFKNIMIFRQHYEWDTMSRVAHVVIFAQFFQKKIKIMRFRQYLR